MKKTPKDLLKPVRYGIEYGALRLLAAIIRAMPVDTASAVIGRIWRWVAPKTKRHARAIAHISAAYPEKTDAECDALVRDMWENLGRIMAESFHLDRLSRAEQRYSYDIAEAQEKIRASGGACVIVSLHTGNWEIAVKPALVSGIEVAGVYQAMTNPYADEYFRALRAPFYPGGLFAKGHDTARKLLAKARGGGAIAFLADLRDVRGVQVPFFGRMAYATPFPVTIARSLGVPLIAARTIRTDGVNFRFHAEVVDIPRDGDRKADIETGTAMVHQVFERWIREYPAQWMWIHKKWANGGAPIEDEAGSDGAAATSG